MPSRQPTDSEPRETAGLRPALAGVINRGFGYFFDAFFFSGAMLFLQWGINQVVTGDAAQYWITAATASILFFLYRFLMDARAKGTFGKAVAGITVTTETGDRLGYSRALKRNFYWLILGPTLVPGSSHPQLHIGSWNIELEPLVCIWVIALMISIYRDRDSRSFLDRWAGAYFI
ncbi:RDD family protein [uncultured Corynebacterium sp.]|uniref:RDD family protein n=1 Tax=uncultured Corynebacterium sp. TaxID=159447 RepID=UPI0025FA321F|nr:RDD family protein [uncultured Corynebacterium sp.]